jgi:hypothetical protein
MRVPSTIQVFPAIAMSRRASESGQPRREGGDDAMDGRL